MLQSKVINTLRALTGMALAITQRSPDGREIVPLHGKEDRLASIKAEIEAVASMVEIRNKRVSRDYPHSSDRQRARGLRQIASGFCKIANGLVRPGQVIVNADGKTFICRPYC